MTSAADFEKFALQKLDEIFQKKNSIPLDQSLQFLMILHHKFLDTYPTYDEAFPQQRFAYLAIHLHKFQKNDTLHLP